MYFSSITTLVLISLVEIIWMLMPSSLSTRNMRLATPTWLRMPMPTMETLQILVSIVGIGMRSHVGVASKMFGTLSAEGINIQMISTSEIKTSVVIDEKYMELAVRALHKAFDLDQAAA